MAILNNRNFIGIELNEDFAKEAIERIRKYSSE
jgi:DNA modification methylase